MTAPILAILLSAAAGSPRDEAQCFSIVAGRAATACGGVLFGHNEDNGLEDVAVLRRISGAGARSYLCLQMPGREASDVLLNDHGVAIASDRCPSREDTLELAGRGIGDPELRHRIAREARSAREGVELAGKLVVELGYAANGRTLIIADPREGWLVGIVGGKHWVAARVPDDAVAVIANTYTIGQVDLKGAADVAGSPDLVDYAARRGWYDPASGPFNFERAYADPAIRSRPENTLRQWSGVRQLAAGEIAVPREGPLPFAVKPKAPVTVELVARALRDHYEGTPCAAAGGEGRSPHRGAARPICIPSTNSSSIFQLRSSIPVEIGALWWLCLWQPCSNPYVPLYLGIDGAPGAEPFGRAYRTFAEHARWLDRDYSARTGPARARWEEFERASVAFQPALEAHVLAAEREDPARAREILTRYCRGAFERAAEIAEDQVRAASPANIR